MNSEQIYKAAISGGCKPVWHDGIFGLAWHCGCDDLRHASDQQCSMITKRSLMRQWLLENEREAY